MKNLNYFLVVLFAVALLTTSCEKEDILPDETPTGITTDQLTGKWTFQSLLYDGTTYVLGSPELADLNDGFNYIQFDLDFVSKTEVNLYMDYRGTDETNANWGYYETYNEYLEFTLVDGVINILELELELKITNVELFDGTTLELKLLGTNLGNQYVPLNGVFTLTK